MSENDKDYSLVNDKNYFQSVRNSGYKSTSKAVAELVDNSIQAGATEVQITFDVARDLSSSRKKKPRVDCVFIRDNGFGMDRLRLREGLRIGGSDRFGDQMGLGRFGMGLKNASFSQCKHLAVRSWRDSGPGLYSYLDIDEISKGEMRFVPRPVQVLNNELPNQLRRPEKSGVVVAWEKCDRLGRNGIAESLATDLRSDLGQVFRKYLTDESLTLEVDGTEVLPFDPLFLDPRCEFSGAHLIGEKEVDLSNLVKGYEGIAVLRVAVLPEQWQKNENSLEPRLQDLIQWRHENSRGFSIVRFDREVDRGLFRIRQQHWSDRWWAGEISFTPELDELFGITNTKQQVTLNSLALDKIKKITKSLVSSAANQVTNRGAKHTSEAQIRTTEDVASKYEPYLGTPSWITEKDSEQTKSEIEQFVQDHDHVPELRSRIEYAHKEGRPVIVEFEKRDSSAFFQPFVVGKVLVVMINSNHAFYHRLVEPMSRADKTTNVGLELFLTSLFKAYTMEYQDVEALTNLVKKWGECLDTYLATDLILAS